jgi:transposase InsO family protein
LGTHSPIDAGKSDRWPPSQEALSDDRFQSPPTYCAELVLAELCLREPNTVWLADTSYMPTDEGFLYLAAMKDLCTKKIVGWSMSKTIDAQFAVDALSMAVARQHHGTGLTVLGSRQSIRQRKFSQPAARARHAPEHVAAG